MRERERRKEEGGKEGGVEGSRVLWTSPVSVAAGTLGCV